MSDSETKSESQGLTIAEAAIPSKYHDEPAEMSGTKTEKLNALERRMRHRAKCFVCQHPEHKKIHWELLNWGSKKKIAEEYALPEKSIKKHCDFFKIDVKKFKRTEYVYQQIIEYGMNNMAALEIKAKDVIHAAERLDKLSGRDIKHLEISGPPTVNFITIPQPGGIKAQPKAEVIEGKLVPPIPIQAEVFNEKGK